MKNNLSQPFSFVAVVISKLTKKTTRIFLLNKNLFKIKFLTEKS